MIGRVYRWITARLFLAWERSAFLEAERTNRPSNRQDTP